MLQLRMLVRIVLSSQILRGEVLSRRMLRMVVLGLLFGLRDDCRDGIIGYVERVIEEIVDIKGCRGPIDGGNT